MSLYRQRTVPGPAASTAAPSLGNLPPHLPLRPQPRPFGGPPNRVCHLVFPTRALPLEHALAGVCREAGARVARSVRVADMRIDVPASDARRIEVVCNGLPFWHGAQFAVDETLPDAQPGVVLARALSASAGTPIPIRS